MRGGGVVVAGQGQAFAAAMLGNRQAVGLAVGFGMADLLFGKLVHLRRIHAIFALVILAVFVELGKLALAG